MRHPPWTVTAVALVVLVGLVSAVVGSPAAAAAPTCTITWVGPAHGAWETAASWSPARVPVATDAVCVGGATPPTVTVNASTSVSDLVVGAAAGVVVRGGTLLRVTATVDVTAGTLTGPGGIAIGSPAATTCCRAGGELRGASHLTRGVRLSVVPGTAVTVADRLGFAGGSTMTNTSQLFLADGAVLGDDDGDPANAFVQTAGRYAALLSDGRARVEVVATVAGDVQPFDPDADIALPRLTNESSAGELRGVDLGGSGGTVTIPAPATSVRNVTLAPISAGIAASTGGSAFATTLRTVTASSVSVSPVFTATQPLTFVRSVLLAYERLSAPAMVFADASRVVVQHGASLDVGRGAGTVSVRADTTSGPVTLTMYQSAVTGSLDQRGGVLSPVGSRSGPARISGDWTIGAGAAVTVGVDRYRAAVPPTDLAIGGSARLDGRFVLTADPHTPPVGTVVPVITAARGITGTFGSVSLAPGYALSYSATAVLATYTG